VNDTPELKISFDTRDEFEAEWEKNISKGGIFLKTDSSLQARQRVHVLIEILDSGANFELGGEAVHVTANGVGVQLDPMPDGILEAIQNLRSPKGKEDKSEEETSGESEASLYQNIQNMSRHEKLAFARKGGMDARAILMRDRDPQVIMNVMLNPRITISEIIQISGSQGLTLDMVKYIVKRADWLTNESVCLNIVLNPKTPLPTALSLLPRLSEKNIRAIAKRPIKQAIKSAAIKIITPK
jgi:Tfp pilus assembly protein PilZ